MSLKRKENQDKEMILHAESIWYEPLERQDNIHQALRAPEFCRSYFDASFLPFYLRTGYILHQSEVWTTQIIRLKRKLNLMNLVQIVVNNFWYMLSYDIFSYNDVLIFYELLCEHSSLVSANKPRIQKEHTDNFELLLILKSPWLYYL